MKLKPLRVSELNQYIKRLIISDPILYNISVEGEISNFKYHQNGHMYFTLKDENSKLRCVMFNEYTSELDWIPENGTYVKLGGYISVYDREGMYQLYVKELKKEGIGELFESLEELKVKLKKEGLFSEKNKLSLPFMPKKVGVITSSTGAVIRDIVTTIKRRMISTDIFIYEAMVQGLRSEEDICRGIKYFNRQENVDVIIIARGGGSIEELWSFNKEQVAREISKSSIPIISAIGHETDFTIADFVSDKRASTPSVAGEIVIPSYDDLNYKINTLLNSVFKSYKHLIDEKKGKNENLKKEIDLNSPLYIIEEYKDKIELLKEDLVFRITDIIENDRRNIENLAENLNTLSPLSTLKRGFSIISDKVGQRVKSVEEVEEGQKMDITLEDGRLEVKILDIEGKVSKDG